MRAVSVALMMLMVTLTAAWAGGNGGSEKLLRLTPDVPGTMKLVPVINLPADKPVVFNGRAGHVKLVGWETGSHAIVSTKSSGQTFRELKFIIFPVPGLQPFQTTEREPGMRFAQQGKNGLSNCKVKLMLVGDKAMLWSTPLTVVFDEPGPPKGPGNRPFYEWFMPLL